MDIEKLKYPIGKYSRPTEITLARLKEWIETIAAFPQQLETVVNGLDEELLKLPYRPDGWNIKQVVHHCADSHMNSFMRYKLALTEENPTIKPYMEAKWADMIDVTEAPVETSVQIIKGLHKRWEILLRSMDEIDFSRTFHHPEHKRDIPLAEITALYAWHCKHHLAHIKQALQLENNFNK